MPDFKKISIEKIPSFYDYDKTFVYITKDEKYKRTTLILYISVNADHEIDFADIETTTIYDVSDVDMDAKILRQHYKDLSKESCEEFKDKIHKKYKDWRKLKFESEFTFEAKENPGRAAYMQYYKFNLPGINHKVKKYKGVIPPSTIT